MTRYDTLLTGGLVADGTGAALGRADVGITDGRVSAVGDLSGADAAVPVHLDAGRVIAPGFIDLHTHTDFTLPRYPDAPAYVHQGVTVHVTGNCGFSPFPSTGGDGAVAQLNSSMGSGLAWDWRDAGGYIARLHEQGLACHVAPLVGHGSIRTAVMGMDDRAPTAAEQEQMRALLLQSLQQGAVGLSTGLGYAPASNADPSEVVDLCRVVASYGGFYATHMRNEREGLLDSVAETLDVARQTGVGVQISHHKAMGRPNWGSVEQSLAMIDEAVAEGIDVTADVYPYTAASTRLASFAPAWLLARGAEALGDRLADPDVRRRAVEELERRGRLDYPHDVVLTSVPPEMEGVSVGWIARERGRSAVETTLELLSEIPHARIVNHGMDPADVDRVLCHPAVAIGSDGGILDPAQGGRPHPRSYGTFPRVLGTYVRDRGLLTLEQAIHKMTGMPARRLRLTDRGTIHPGAWADLVVIDPDRVADVATYEDPHRFSTGIEHVFLEGTAVLSGGRPTGERPGHVL